MISYLTKAELREWSESWNKIPSEREQLRKSLSESQNRSLNGSTFLSHSSQDDELMPAVVRLLENHGAKVYLDKRDPTLESQTPREIANTLRQRIRATKKFVLFTTNNSMESKWVPWELGLADDAKGTGAVALLPAVEKAFEFQWTEQEYLGIYDRIIWGDLKGYNEPLWMVWNFVENTATPLSRWLAD
jgi:hypothetical protein